METVFSLASYNATNKVSNAEWESSLSNNVILNDGDTLAVKTVYIDTRTLGSDNIIIEEDTPISIDYYYYYNNTETQNTIVISKPWNWGEGESQNNFEAGGRKMTNADGLPYLLVMYYFPYDYNARLYDKTKPMQWTPVVGTWSMYLRKGAYAKDYLAQLITKNMASVYPTNLDYFVELNMGLNNQNSFDQFVASMQTQNVEVLYFAEMQANRNFLIHPYVEQPEAGGLNMFINYSQPDGDTNFPSNIPSSQSTRVACAYVSILDYDKKYNLEQETTPAGKPPIQPMGHNYFGQYTTAICPYIDARGLKGAIDVTIPDFYTKGGGQLISCCAGASQISLLWDNQNNNIFSWDYIHTPIIVGGKQCVTMNAQAVGNAVEKDEELQGYQTWAMCDRQSGIIFSALYPTSFWNDTLGFQNITTNFSASTNPALNYQLTKTDYLGLTTSNYWGLNNMMTTYTINSGSFIYQFPATIRDQLYRQMNGQQTGIPPTTYVWESDVTNTLDASSPPVNPNDTGHFLLEIQGYTNSFFDEQNSYQVKSIVSNYYISPNSFATAPFPDSFIYIHSGDPMLIRQLKVRILSPKTKQPYPLLGPNSTVYMQLTQNITPEKIQE